MAKIKIFSDGGARGNPGPAASAFIVINENENKIHEQSMYLGATTNNVAEYTAVLMAVEWLTINKNKLSITKVDYLLDSELVTRQLNGEYKIKNQVLKNIAIKIKNILNNLEIDVNFQHIRRDSNTAADILVNKTLDMQDLPLEK